ASGDRRGRAADVHARAVRGLVDPDLGGDAGTHLGDVADDADGAATVTEPVEHVEHLLEALLVEAAEALVDEEGAELVPTGLLADAIGEAERQGERDGEGLAARERVRGTLSSGPQVADDQTETTA